MEIATEENLPYHKYSYSRRADIYRLDLDAENVLRIEEAADRLASGKPARRLCACCLRPRASFRLPAVGKWHSKLPVRFVDSFTLRGLAMIAKTTQARMPVLLTP